jgi:hypothetical protein
LNVFSALITISEILKNIGSNGWGWGSGLFDAPLRFVNRILSHTAGHWLLNYPDAGNSEILNRRFILIQLAPVLVAGWLFCCKKTITKSLNQKRYKQHTDNHRRSLQEIQKK